VQHASPCQTTLLWTCDISACRVPLLRSCLACRYICHRHDSGAMRRLALGPSARLVAVLTGRAAQRFCQGAQNWLSCRLAQVTAAMRPECVPEYAALGGGGCLMGGSPSPSIGEVSGEGDSNGGATAVGSLGNGAHRTGSLSPVDARFCPGPSKPMIARTSGSGTWLRAVRCRPWPRPLRPALAAGPPRCMRARQNIVIVTHLPSYASARSSLVNAAS